MDLVQGLGSGRRTVSSSAVALPTIPQGARIALIRCKTSAVCFTDDGVTVPTASVGMELEAGDILWFNGHLSQFSAIRRDGSDATLVVNFYGAE